MTTKLWPTFFLAVYLFQTSHSLHTSWLGTREVPYSCNFKETNKNPKLFFLVFAFSKGEVRLLDSPSPFWGSWCCWSRIQMHSCAFFSISHQSTSHCHCRSQTHPHCNYPTMQCCLSSYVLPWYAVDLFSLVPSLLASSFSFFSFLRAWVCSLYFIYFFRISFTCSEVGLSSVRNGLCVKSS